MRRERLPWWILPVLAGCAWAIVERDHGPGHESIPWLASAVVLAALIPGLLRSRARLLGRETYGPIPFMPLIGSIYAIYYGLPALLSDQPRGIGYGASPDALEAGLEVALIGVLSLVVGYHLLGPRVPLGRPVAVDWDPVRARAYALAALPVGFLAQVVFRMVELPGPLIRPVQVFGMIFPLAIGALLMLARDGHVSKSLSRLVWFGLTPGYVILQASDGFVGAAARAGVFVAMLVWGCGKRVPLYVMVGGFLFVAVFRAGGHEYRRATSDLVETGAIVDRLALVGELAYEELDERGIVELSDAIIERLAQIVVLAGVVERTPRGVPYWEGSTYATLPSTFVPRILWPDKPRKNVGQRFGHRYGFIKAHDFETSVNLPQLVEAYANFGRAGVIGVMALIGVAYRRLERMLNHGRAPGATVLAGAAVLSPMINVESDASMIFGEVFQVAVVVWLGLRLVRRRGPATAPVRPQLALAGSES